MKNFKKITLVAFTFLMGGQIMGQVDSVSTNDTANIDTEVRFGKIRVIFEDDNEGISFESNKKRKLSLF